MSTTPQDPFAQSGVPAFEPGRTEPVPNVDPQPSPLTGHQASPSSGGDAPLAPAARPRPGWVVPVAAGAAGLVLGVPVGVGLTLGVQAVRAHSSTSSLLTGAVESCALASVSGIDLADEGRSITFDMKGDEDLTGADYLDIACLFGALDMPASVSSHVDQTTSMDGRQTESWDNITVSWSYHPDRGLDGVLTVAEK